MALIYMKCDLVSIDLLLYSNIDSNNVNIFHTFTKTNCMTICVIIDAMCNNSNL